MFSKEMYLLEYQISTRTCAVFGPTSLCQAQHTELVSCLVSALCKVTLLKK